MDDPEGAWQRRGGTLSDKTAREEYGLTQDAIVRAIRAGKLRYRVASMYGNPWLRLLRAEVEALVEEARGGGYLRDRQARTALAGIDRELRRLRRKVAALEAQRAELTAGLGK